MGNVLMGSLLCLALAAFPASAAASRDDLAVVGAASVRARFQAYGQVEPPLAWGRSAPARCAVGSGLWLKAVFYGADAAAVRPGLRGSFQPADASARAIPVKVCAVFGLQREDGGEAVALVADAPGRAAARRRGWRNGTFGTVVVLGPAKTMARVPTSALILDRGRWWALRRVGGADVPTAVVPGRARGWNTFVEKGLSPGDRVVAAGAYLEFHRRVAKSYQPPD